MTVKSYILLSLGKACLLLFIPLLLMSFISCEKGRDDILGIPISENKNIMEIDAHIYSSEELKHISEKNLSVIQLNNKYPIECIRKIEDGYRVVYKGENEFLIITFDNDGILISYYSVLPNTSLSVFQENIVVGTSLNDVLSFDSSGNYLFMQTGRIDMPKISTHYTSDGYLIKVFYDDEYIVTELKEEIL